MPNELKIKFNNAKRTIPDYESLASSKYYIHDNNLYYKGMASWFIILNFIESEINGWLTLEDIEQISMLESDDIKIVKLEDDKYSLIKTENAELRIIIRETNDKPDIDRPKIHKFKDIPDILKYGKNLESLTTNVSSLCAVPYIDNEKGILLMYEKQIAAGVIGKDIINIDFIQNKKFLKVASSDNYTMFFDGNKAYMYKKYKDYSIYVGLSMKEPGIMKHTLSSIKNMLSETTNTEVINVVISTTELYKMFRVIEKISKDMKIDMYVKKDKIEVYKEHQRTIKLNYTLPVVSNGELKFTTKPITKQMLDFLIDASGSPTDSDISMSLYPKDKRLILRLKNNIEDENNDSAEEAFIIMGLSFSIK